MLDDYSSSTTGGAGLIGGALIGGVIANEMADNEMDAYQEGELHAGFTISHRLMFGIIQVLKMVEEEMTLVVISKPEILLSPC